MSANYQILKGRYKLEEELGRGAFGVTHRALDMDMHSQQVVVKILSEEGARVDGELKALTLINDQNVVRVSDHGWTPDGRSFFVMQYVKGKSLKRVLQEGGAMELRRAAHIVRQLGDAVSAVHDACVIHRDVKPDNVMLQTTRDGETAILIDFGLATIKDPLASLREQGTWAGTPLYMAPEQLRNQPIPASDVWALGVVAYEMVTGQKPFSLADVDALAHTPRAFTEPKALRPDLPEAARDVILKALSYDPPRRYAHAHEMGDAFTRAVINIEPALPPPPPSAPASLKELLRDCRELFESLDEFRDPDSLRAFFSKAELSAYQNCVGRGARLEFDHLLYCLYRAGRRYQGHALVELLDALASHYKGHWPEQKCARLSGSLKQLLEQQPTAGRT